LRASIAWWRTIVYNKGNNESPRLQGETNDEIFG
jgi:hypothetical protein